MYSNSLEAVCNTLAHGFDFMELDLSITSDGELVAWQIQGPRVGGVFLRCGLSDFA